MFLFLPNSGSAAQQRHTMRATAGACGERKPNLMRSHVEARHVAHLVQDPARTAAHVGAGRFAAEAQGGRERGGDERAVAARELRRFAVEMLLRHGFHAIDAVAHLDAVEIDFHDALFRPEQLDQYGEIGLEALAHPRTRGPEKHVFRRLLRDGATAQAASALHALHQRVADGLGVETAVDIKLLILRGDDGHGKRGRHLLKRHPTVVQTQTLAATPLLDTADHHQRGDVDRHPSQGDHRKKARHKENAQRPTAETKEFIHEHRIEKKPILPQYGRNDS